ncbi:MAG: PilZ domain-containing protein [Gammaproteobacteria bacterium]|nr:PilZ domain-containing protein [Gammaproteobacteria bacterium]
MNAEENKRGYFRVDDEVFLQVNKVPSDEVVNMDIYFEKYRQSTLITGRFHQQRTAMAPVLAEINARDAGVAQYFSMLSDQIDLLADKLISESIFAANEPLQAVNMSAEGMRFQTTTEYQLGDQLQMIFALFPGGDYIPVIAEVVRVDSDPESKQNSVSVDYSNIHEDDKELLIHHILFLQRQQLQKKRLDTGNP